MEDDENIIDESIVAEELPAEEVVEPEITEEQEDDEVIVTIGGDAPPAEEPAPEWVKELRKTNRELQRENRELEKKLASTSETKPDELGPKPTLSDSSIDYDTDKYEQALSAWHERKRNVDDEQSKKRKAEDEQRAAWDAKVDAYNKSKTELNVKDYAEAEAELQEFFSVTQQGIVIQGAENPALVNYALGKNPLKAKELAAIKDPVKFAFAIAKLETQLKVTNKRPPAPEKVITGSKPLSGGDSALDKLREEAERTGDFSKVVKYKRDKRKS